MTFEIFHHAYKLACLCLIEGSMNAKVCFSGFKRWYVTLKIDAFTAREIRTKSIFTVEQKVLLWQHSLCTK